MHSRRRGHLTRFTAASQLPSRRTALRADASAASTAATSLATTSVPCSVSCHSLSSRSAPGSRSAHGSACSDERDTGFPSSCMATFFMAAPALFALYCGQSSTWQMIYVQVCSVQPSTAAGGSGLQINILLLTTRHYNVYPPAAGAPPGPAWPGRAARAAVCPEQRNPRCRALCTAGRAARWGP
jgi:hypothetical protein